VGALRQQVMQHFELGSCKLIGLKAKSGKTALEDSTRLSECSLAAVQKLMVCVGVCARVL
jgi:hypothetical protein